MQRMDEPVEVLTWVQFSSLAECPNRHGVGYITQYNPNLRLHDLVAQCGVASAAQFGRTLKQERAET